MNAATANDRTVRDDSLERVIPWPLSISRWGGLSTMAPSPGIGLPAGGVKGAMKNETTEHDIRTLGHGAIGPELR
jgi:hypothetical protein